MSTKNAVIVAYAIALLFALGCTSGEKVTELPGGKEFEGWAGPPDSPTTKPFDHFYMKHTARASVKAVEKKSGAMMQSTCTEAATLQGKGNLMRKMIGETLQGASGVSDGESTGMVLVSEFSGKIKGVSTKACKGLAQPDPQVPYSEYKECECIIFTKIEGGKDAIIARAKEVENK